MKRRMRRRSRGKKEREEGEETGTARVVLAAGEEAGLQEAAGMTAGEARAGMRRKRAIIASKRGQISENSRKAAVGGWLKTKR